MDRLADLVHHRDSERPHFPGVGVELDLGDIAAPGVGSVRIAAVVGIIPADPLRLLVLARDRQWTMLPEILRRCEPAQLRRGSPRRLAGEFARPPCMSARRRWGRCRGRRRYRVTATSICSYGMPRVSATIWACMVRVPWPISVLEVSTRAPEAVSSTVAREASFSSPLPVNPGAMPVHREPDAIPRSGVGLSLLAVSGAANGSAQDLERAAVVAQASGRSRSCRQAGAGSARRRRTGIHAEGLGDALDMHLHRELCLRRAEPAERAVGRRVGEHRPRRDPGIVAPVRTGRVDRTHAKGPRERA